MVMFISTSVRDSTFRIHSTAVHPETLKAHATATAPRADR